MNESREQVRRGVTHTHASSRARAVSSSVGEEVVRGDAPFPAHHRPAGDRPQPLLLLLLVIATPGRARDKPRSDTAPRKREKAGANH
jgi:hypothetical protein